MAPVKPQPPAEEVKVETPEVKAPQVKDEDVKQVVQEAIQPQGRLKINAKKVIKELADEYALLTNKAQDEQWLAKVKTKLDLGTMATRDVNFSNLRMACLRHDIKPYDYVTERDKLVAKYPLYYEEFKKFDHLNAADQHKLQKRYKRQKKSPAMQLLMTLPVLPAILKKVALTKLQRAQLVIEKDDKQAKKASKGKIQIPRNYITHVLQGLDSNESKDLLPALLLATGRRCYSEILYQNSGIDSAGQFYGQAKKTEEAKPYTIPLLSPLEKVQDGIKRIRVLMNTEGRTRDEIKFDWSATISSSKKPWMPPTDFAATPPKSFIVHPHLMRHIYTAKAIEIAKPTNPTRYAQQILGLESEDVAMKYMDIELVGDEKIPLSTSSIPEEKVEPKHTPEELKALEPPKPIEDKRAANIQVIVPETKEDEVDDEIAQLEAKIAALKARKAQNPQVPEFKSQNSHQDKMIDTAKYLIQNRLKITPTAMRKRGKHSIPAAKAFIQANQHTVDYWNNKI